jgi:hypothetical protein
MEILGQFSPEIDMQRKLGADGGIGDHIPKPKWMRWRTYERHLEQIASAEQIIDGHLAAFLYKLDPSLGR